MFLSPDQINHNTAWLLGHGSPAVRYLTHKYLLKTPSNSEDPTILWKDVETCAEAQEIFARQDEDGSWCAGGSWALEPSYELARGRDPVTPKYVTTVWILPLLGEMGFTIQDGRVRKACDYVLSNGYFRHPIFQGDASAGYAGVEYPCCFGQYLVALASVGCQSDPRTRAGFEFLLQKQSEDGGWVLDQHYRERHWTRSCPASTYPAVLALYLSRNPAYRLVLVNGLNFISWHLSTKEDRELERFFFHGHSLVHELQMLSELKVGVEQKAARVTLEWLKTMYCADDGCFHYRGKPISKYSRREDGMDARVAKYRLHHMIEDDWLTYRLTRIGMNLL